MTTNNIKTLQQLADYINENEEWQLATNDIIEQNGWQDETGETRRLLPWERKGGYERKRPSRGDNYLIKTNNLIYSEKSIHNFKTISYE